MPHIRRRLLVAALVLAPLWLGACETPAPPRPVYPPITFEDRTPIRLDVGDITVELAYRAPGGPPHVEHLFPALPSDAARRWPKDRLVAGGTALRAEYVIHEASVVAVPLERSSGLTGLVTKEQSERYDARVVVELRIVDTLGRVVASARAEAVRARSVAEDISLNERDRVWYEMTQDIMSELDRQLEQTIKTAFFPYVLQ